MLYVYCMCMSLAHFPVLVALKEAIEMLDKGSTDKEQYLKELEDLEGELIKLTASNL